MVASWDGYAEVVGTGNTILRTKRVFERLSCVPRFPYLCDFTKGASFFTEINYHSTPASETIISKDYVTPNELHSLPLCFFHCFLDAVYEVWATCTDIRSKHVTSVTLVAKLAEDPQLITNSKSSHEDVLPRREPSKLSGPSHLTSLLGHQSNRR